MIKNILLFSCILGLAGCGTVERSIVASDENFVILRAGAGDSFASLAAEFLGDANQASVIARYNPGLKITSGKQLAIPKRNLNASGVFVNGYQRIPILCYHQFSDKANTENSMMLPAAQFEAQMAFLKNNEYQVVTLGEVRAFLDGDRELPDKAVVITIDDGYRSFYTVAYPILGRYNFPATLFVYPDFIGGGLGLGWDQIAALHKDPLVDIQSHSKSHANLGPRPGGENAEEYITRLENEVEATDRVLSQKIGRPADYFAYPYGNSSLELVKLLQKNEYELGLTVRKGGNSSFAPPYLMRRTMVYSDDSLETFGRYLDVFKKISLK